MGISLKKYGYFIPVLFLICTYPALAQDIYESEPEAGAQYSGQSGNSIVLTFTSSDPQFERKLVKQKEFFTIDIPGFQQSNNPGRPQLPVYTQLIDFTGKELVSITVSKVRTKRFYPGSKGYSGQLYPDQPSRTKKQDPQDLEFIQDLEYYNQNKPEARDTVSLVELGTIRGRNMSQLIIEPVIYYPSANYFDLITSLEVNIETSSLGKAESIANTIFSTKGISSKGIGDYQEDDVTPGFTLSPAGMIIVSDTSMKEHLKPLIDWKVRKGFRVTELYIGESGLERNFTSIKDTLDKIWAEADEDNPHPDFLILGGDLGLIPESEGASNLSDMYYGEFDGGGDFLPDMYIGRLPAADTTDMKAIVEKILQYERFEYGDSISHFEESMLLAGYDAGNVIYMDGQHNYASNNYLNSSNNIENYLFLHESNTTIRTHNYDSAQALFDDGLGFINYTGHGSPTEWLSTGIDYSFVETLTNQRRYPVIISNACQTAQFSNSNNMAAAFVKAKDKGALAFIGATVNTYWNEDYWWAVGLSSLSANPEYNSNELGFYDRLFHTHNEQASDWFTSLGQIMHAGNMAVLSSTSSYKQIYWEYYHLLGDPSIIPMIGEPSEFDIEVPDSIPIALKGLTITAEPFSYAAISHFDTLWDASALDMAGNAYLSLPQLAQKDSCLLVLTGQNKIPFIKTLYFNEPDTAWLDIIDIIPADTGGDGNDTADYGETLSLEVIIQNAGGQDANGAYIKLESDNEYISIEDPDSVIIGDIALLSEISLSDNFAIVIHDSIPDKTFAEFNLDLYYGPNIISRQFDIKLHAPDLSIGSFSVNDQALGNGNLRPEPGESIDIILEVINNGSSSTSGVLELLNLSPYLSIGDLDHPTGDIGPGETIAVQFSGMIDPTTPDSENITFSSRLLCDPYRATANHGFIVGGSIEDFESNDFTNFPWDNNDSHPWLISSDIAFNNSLSAVSGLNNSDDNQESRLTMMLNMPLADTVSFWYRVSSELYEADSINWGDFFIFSINDTIKLKRSGEVNWSQVKYPLPKGVHTLEWIYDKDPNTYEGDDKAWIDMIKFPAVAFLQRDISVDSLISPSEPSKDYGNEQVRARVRNYGRDTIYTLPLSYIVNNEPPVSEVFSVEIFPGDSTSVIFLQTADLGDQGEYLIKVFLQSPDDYDLNDTILKSVVSTAIVDIITNSSDFKLAPNPFNSQVNIISNIALEGCKFSLYDSRGRKVREYKTPYISDGERIVINGETLVSGFYILKIDTPTGIYMYKLIKN